MCCRLCDTQKVDRFDVITTQCKIARGVDHHKFISSFHSWLSCAEGCVTKRLALREGCYLILWLIGWPLHLEGARADANVHISKGLERAAVPLMLLSGSANSLLPLLDCLSRQAQASPSSHCSQAFLLHNTSCNPPKLKGMLRMLGGERCGADLAAPELCSSLLALLLLPAQALPLPALGCRLSLALDLFPAPTLTKLVSPCSCVLQARQEESWQQSGLFPLPCCTPIRPMSPEMSRLSVKEFVPRAE